jgi:hypothetical protein
LSKLTAAIVGLILVAACSGCSEAVELPAHSGFFASPDGTLDGDGTVARPWDLATAIGRADRLSPGDTLWLLRGRYRGDFVSLLTGDSTRRVVVRQFPGHRATIDGGLTVRGDHGEYWDFEVMNSKTDREAKAGGSSPSDYQRSGGVDDHGSDTKFINLIIHDTGGGFGIWSTGSNVEVYGCLIYNNGWEGPDRGHGHGIYGQNRTGTKLLEDNVVFHQFGNGFQLYGSDQAFLVGFRLVGNVAFENGALASEPYAIDLFVGGGSPSADIVATDNFTYRSDGLLTARFGYDPAVVNDDLVLLRNYFVGQTQIMNWQRLTAEQNTFTGAQNLVELHVPQGTDLGSYAWGGSTYLPDRRRRAPNSDQPFVMTEADSSRAFDMNVWRQRTGFDATGTLSERGPTGQHVFVRPNRYDKGRANIIVYNWAGAKHADVDVSGVLQAGDQYEVRSVQDYFGRAVLKGTYDGERLRLSMREYPAATPVGSSPSKPPRMGPEFSVFVLQRMPR